MFMSKFFKFGLFVGNLLLLNLIYIFWIKYYYVRVCFFFFSEFVSYKLCLFV